MSFDINEFIQNTSEEFIRDAHFSVQLSLPTILSDMAAGSDRQLSFLCNGAEIPGRRLRTQTISRYGLGLFQPYAVGTQYEPLTLDFYCDANANVLKVLHTWQDRIFPPMSDTTGFRPNGLKVEFPENYFCNLSLFQHNSKGEKIIEWKFIDAFPESLTSVNLSWASRNNFVIVKAIFAYAYYEQAQVTEGINNISTPAKPAPNNQIPQISTTPINPGAGSFGGAGASGSW